MQGRVAQKSGATDLLQPVANVLGRLVVFLSTEIPDGKRTKEKAKDGDGANPDIDKARREIVADRAKRTPTFGVGAEGLGLGLEVAMQVLHWADAREGTRMQQALLGIGIIHRGSRWSGRVVEALSSLLDG